MQSQKTEIPKQDKNQECKLPHTQTKTVTCMTGARVNWQLEKKKLYIIEMQQITILACKKKSPPMYISGEYHLTLIQLFAYKIQ